MKGVRQAFALAALFLASPAGALDELSKLSSMVDELQRVQVQIAQGDKAAYPAELKQMKTMAAAIAAAKPETWKDKREADSLVIYILSGGSLVEVAPLVKDETILESERPLVRGAIAYVTNHEADAIGLLDQVDLTALDIRLAGQIAFARSVLEMKRDPRAAARLLDWARLLAPGGLVEEAALRREIALVVETRDVRRVAMLTRQYSTRFAASLFALDFFDDLARMIARLGLADDPANYQLLSDATASLPAESRRNFLLTLAKASVVNARFDAASAAAAEALRGARPESPEEARAHLYLDAGRIFSDGYDAALADLHGLAAAKFDRSDADLLASVRSVAAALRVTPRAAVETQDAPPGGDAHGKTDEPAQTIDRAWEALKRTSHFADASEGGAQ
jgi:chemotaxis protein MotC